MKFKVLKECVLESEYYDVGEFYIPSPYILPTTPFIVNAVIHGFLENLQPSWPPEFRELIKSYERLSATPLKTVKIDHYNDYSIFMFQDCLGKESSIGLFLDDAFKKQLREGVHVIRDILSN